MITLVKSSIALSMQNAVSHSERDTAKVSGDPFDRRHSGNLPFADTGRLERVGITGKSLPP